MRIKLILAYDGTNYGGYQSQTNTTAVQDVLERAIGDLFKEKIRTMGASRTDTGVHAEGNVACFDVETRIAPGTPACRRTSGCWSPQRSRRTFIPAFSGRSRHTNTASSTGRFRIL